MDVFSEQPIGGRLQQLAGEAFALEATDPLRAAAHWRELLAILPPGTAEFAAISQRIGALSGMPAHGASAQVLQAQGSHGSYRLAPGWRDSLPTALLKTGGSMLLSIIVYGFLFGGDFRFALGFVLLILIHEMGHVVAMRYYNLSASPPIFIPFVGALINLRQNPPNAKVEAIVGIGGPLAGTLGTLVCYALFLFVPAFHTPGFLMLSAVGFFLNLFNLLPMPPMDGGRITAAVSPWVWLVGLAGIVALIVRDIRHMNYGILVLVMILLSGLPRLRMTLRARGRDNPYYRISRAATWTIGVLYVSLAVLLSVLLFQTGGFALLQF